MANERSNKGGGCLAALLLVIDLGLLCWIGTSWYAERKAQPADTGDHEPGASYTDPADGGDSGWFDMPSASTDPTNNGTENWILDTQPTVSADPASGQSAEQPDIGQFAEAEDPAQDGASRFGAVGRPETSDFQTWYEQNIIGSIPSDARIITDFREAAGAWKGLIRYTAPDSGEVTASELVNFDLSGTAENSRFVVDWYLIWFSGDGEWSNEEDMEDTAFSGLWADGSLSASGPGSIRMKTFYEWDGAQYAVGEMDAPDGSVAVIGMVRP